MVKFYETTRLSGVHLQGYCDKEESSTQTLDILKNVTSDDIVDNMILKSNKNLTFFFKIKVKHNSATV